MLRSSLISQISLPELAPYVEFPQIMCFMVHLGRLPGFIGPIPSTSLDKAAIQLLPLLYGAALALVKG
jgi:hypothetical protein